MKQFLLFLLLVPYITFSQTQIGQSINGSNEGAKAGSSVAISSDGNIIVINEPENDTGEEESGQVRVFENINNLWTQLGQTLNGEAEFDNFGDSVALSDDGNILAVGIPFNDENGSASGKVKIYNLTNNLWTQLGQDLLGVTGQQLFGDTIDISSDGNTILIGATNAGFSTCGNLSNSGYIKVFNYINNSWSQIGQTICGEATGYAIGRRLAISDNGQVIAVNSRYGLNREKVIVYNLINDSWVQRGDDIIGEYDFDQANYGISLSSDGNIVSIAAPFNDDGGTDSGHVRVFSFINNVWTQIGSDIDGESDNELLLNTSLSSNGDILAIGVPFNDDGGTDSGQVRIYKNINNNWVQIGEDINSDFDGDWFGNTIKLSSDGTTLIVGASLNDDGGTDSGQVKIYDLTPEVALSEVVEDILGNTNGVNVTATQLNSIIGVSGALDGVNYTTALDNGTFVDENNPTASEIQTIIDQVNATLNNPTFLKQGYILYPNPTTNQFTIQLQQGLELKNVSIFNEIGQFVLSSEKTTTNVSNLSQGIYFVEVTTNKGISTQKLIIE